MTERWSGNWKLAALVRNHSRAKATARHVLLELAYLADSSDGWTAASLADLEYWTGYATHTILKAITEDQLLGELEVERGSASGPRDARRGRYRVRDEVLRAAPTRHVNGAATAPFNGAATAPLRRPNGAATAPSTVQPRHVNGAATAPSMVQSANDARAYPENQITRRPDGARARARPTTEEKPAKYFEDLWRARCVDHRLVSFPQDVNVAGQSALSAQTAGVPLVAILEAINAAVLEKAPQRVHAIALELQQQPIIAGTPAEVP